MNSVCLRVLVLVLVFESGHSNSSCDDIFGFFTDGEYEFGEFTLKPVEVVSQLLVTINYTVQARLDDYIGRLDSPEDVLRKYNRGETVKYRVYFPLKSPRPKVTSISINDAAICTGPGDQSRYQVVTSASLGRFSSYGVGGGPPPYKRFSHNPQTTPQPIAQTTSQYIPIAQTTSQYIPPKAVYSYNPHPNPDDDKYIKAFLQRFTNPNGQVTVAAAAPVTQQRIIVRPTTTTTTTPKYVETVTHRPYRPPVQRFPDTTTTATETCGEVAGGSGFSSLISDGESYERGDIPWLVAIYTIVKKKVSFTCGGTLVSNRHVITAAHCMYRRQNTNYTQIVVKLGVHELDDWSDDLAVIAKLIDVDVPKSYDFVKTMLKDDIMVLTLDKRVTFTNFIRPACLWSGNTELSRVVGNVGVVAGWGGLNKQNSVPLDEPQRVYVPIVSTKECRASNSYFHQVTSNNTLCAGSRKGVGPCAGDSGGGLYLKEGGKWRLRGIVSLSVQEESGKPCNLNEYIVYTDTAQYLPWIRSILTKNHYD